MNFGQIRPEDYYRAMQLGMDGAADVGAAMVVHCEGDNLKAVLATLARAVFVKHSLELGIADMLKVPLATVTRLEATLELALILDRVINHGLTAENALVLSCGRWGPEITKCAETLGKKEGVKESIDSLADFEARRPRDSYSQHPKISGINS